MLRIEVTQQDIEHGQWQDCEECPIALAVTRAVGFTVEVGTNIKAAKPGDRRNTDLPEECVQFIHAFDAREPVKPFVFWLPYVEQWDGQKPQAYVKVYFGGEIEGSIALYEVASGMRIHHDDNVEAEEWIDGFFYCLGEVAGLHYAVEEAAVYETDLIPRSLSELHEHCQVAT